MMISTLTVTPSAHPKASVDVASSKNVQMLMLNPISEDLIITEVRETCADKTTEEQH